MSQANRLISLDALRGFTIAAMIMVNFPGSEQYVYFTLRHTKWNGLSFTDNIAPVFLFVIGISIVLAYAKRKNTEPKGKLYRKIIFRSLKIFAVGMFLNLMPDFDFDAFNHDQPVGENESEEAPVISVVAPVPSIAAEAPVVPVAASSTVTNTSATEEVDKW